jgi:alpha-tubulin suppressor-like RCC1 family protein
MYVLGRFVISLLFAAILSGCLSDAAPESFSLLPSSNPISITLNNPITTPNNSVATPTIKISNTKDLGMVTLHASVDCTDAAIATTASVLGFTLLTDSNPFVSNESRTYYAQFVNQLSEVSNCVGPVTYTYDTTPPVFNSWNYAMASTIAFGAGQSGNESVPSFSLDVNESGGAMDVYQGTSCSGTLLQNYNMTSDAITVNGTDQTSMPMVGMTYSFRYTDRAGNSVCATTDSYYFDNVAPVVTVMPSENANSPAAAVITGLCEANGSAVSISGTDISAPITTPCVSGNYSAAVSFLLSGNKSVIVSQSDLLGNVASVTRNLNIYKTATNITLGVPTSVIAGTAFTVTVQIRDIDGNIVTAGPDSTALISITKVAGAGNINGTLTVNAANGQATLNSLSINTADSYSLEATKSATAGAGSTSSMSATSNNFNISHGPISLTTSSVNSTATVKSGHSVPITLDLRDQFNNSVKTGLYTVIFSDGGNGGTSSGTFGPITNNGDGIYTSQFLGTTAGTPLSIKAKVDGTDVVDQTLITVVPGDISPTKSLITITNSSIPAGTQTTVTLQGRDLNNNILTASSDLVIFSNSGGTSTGNWGATTNNGNGTFSAIFFGTGAGTATTIMASINSVGVTTTLPTITVTPALVPYTWTGALSTDWNNAANWVTGIPGPTNIAIFDNSCTSRCSPSNINGISVLGIDVKSTYTGTIDFSPAANNSINIGTSGLTIKGGQLIAGGAGDSLYINGALTIDGPSAIFNMSGANIFLFSDVSVINSGNYLYGASTLNIVGSLTRQYVGLLNVNNLNILMNTPGRLDLNNQMVSVNGDMGIICPAGSSRPSMEMTNGTFLVTRNLTDFTTSSSCGSFSVNSVNVIFSSSTSGDSLTGSPSLNTGYLFNNMTINGLANFNVKHVLSLMGNLTVNNSLIDVWSNSTLEFIGSTPSTIHFPTTTSVNALHLFKSAGANVIIDNDLQVDGDLNVNQTGSQISGDDILLSGNLNINNNNGGSSNIFLIGFLNQYVYQDHAAAKFPGLALTASNSLNTIFQSSNLALDYGSQSLVLESNSNWNISNSASTLTISNQLILGPSSKFVENCASVYIQGISSVPTVANLNQLNTSGAIVYNGGLYYDGSEGIMISTPNYSVVENTGGMPLSVVMSGNTNCEPIPFALTPSLIAGASTTLAKTPDDFNTTPLVGTIYANSNSSSTNNYIPVNDNMYELAELHQMTFSSLYRGINVTDYVGDLTITNDDSIPTIQFNTTTSSIAEGNAGTSTANLQLNISHPSSVPLQVMYSLDSSSTAASGLDYILSGSNTITFPAESSASLNFNVSIIGDVVNDDAEFIKFNLSGLSAPAPNIGTISQHTLIINDDDVSSPSVIGVSTTANSNDVFSDGQSVFITLIFDQNVTVDTSGGTPSLKLNTSPTIRYANYQSGSGTAVLTFKYDVLANDLASAPMAYFDSNSLLLNGGTIKDASMGTLNANLTLPLFTNAVDLFVKNIRINPRPVITKSTCMIEVYQGENYEGCSVSAININDPGDAVTNYSFFPGASATDDCNWISVGMFNTITGILNNSVTNANVGRCNLRFKAFDGYHYSEEFKVSLNVTPKMGFSGVDVAGFHGCAVVDGRVKCWGRQENNVMALGDGTVLAGNYSNYAIPTDVAGGHYIDEVTRVKTSGNSALESFSCLRTSSGQLQCWGRNSKRQLGNGIIETFRSYVNSTVIDTNLTPIQKVTSYDLGSEFGCAVIQTSDPNTTGKVMCWGAGEDFQLGNGVNADSQYAVYVKVDASTLLVGAVQVATGANHACALMGDKSVKCWGANTNGQLGRNNTLGLIYAAPVIGFDSAKQAIQIAATDNTNCVILIDGKIQCWGFGGMGVRGSDNSITVGDGTQMMSTLTSINFQNTDPAVELAMGGFTSCAIFKPSSGNNYARCWGDNSAGQLGRGNKLTVGNGSLLMSGLGGIDLGTSLYPKSISVGVVSVCATVATTTSTKGVKCWGKNTNGQLGDGYSFSDRGDGPNEMANFLNFNPLNPQIYISEYTVQGNKVLDTDPLTGGIGICQKVALDNNHPAGRQARVLVSQKPPAYSPSYPLHFNTNKNWKYFPSAQTYDMRDVYSSTVPVVKRSGSNYIAVASNWDELFSLTINLSSAIDTRFTGASLTGVNFWTGSYSAINSIDNGTWDDATCSNWTSSSGAGGDDNMGVVGEIAFDDYWINASGSSCNNLQPVYCVMP